MIAQTARALGLHPNPSLPPRCEARFSAGCAKPKLSYVRHHQDSCLSLGDQELLERGHVGAGCAERKRAGECQRYA
jgi:hypothetical protein